MKNNKIFIFAFILVSAMFFTSCEDHENVVFDSVNGQTMIQFNGSDASIPVDVSAVSTTEVTVAVTTVSNQERTINVSVDPTSTATSNQYSITSFVIPAGEYSATATVTGNYSALPASGSVNLILKLDGIEGGSAVVRNETYNIKLERFCPLVIADFYGDYSSMQSTADFGSLQPGPVVTITAGPANNTLLLTNIYGTGRQAVIELDYSDIINPAVIHRSLEFGAVYQTFASTGPLYTFAFASQASDNTFSTCDKTIRLNFYRANASSAYNPPYFMELTKN